ncbi:MAG: DUF2064 domain-containing protein [Acidobacteria bacterium]|nr:DUF2064 domain-containing protein [Acidobacteriota bacterium]
MTRFPDRRSLILFAREPSREARAKGFSASGAVDLFASFATGWLDAAERAGARLVVAAPAEDLAAWRRRLPSDRGISFIAQRGRSFGERVEESARRIASEGDSAVLVGGDVPPSARAVGRAFDALDREAGAVLAPAPDGGVSLIAIRAEDLDLLRRLTAGSTGVFATLADGLEERGRTVELVDIAPDVDSRRDLRRLLRAGVVFAARSLARCALALPSSRDGHRPSPRSLLLAGPSGLRAPPAFA